jgi:hypothetical protein
MPSGIPGESTRSVQVSDLHSRKSVGASSRSRLASSVEALRPANKTANSDRSYAPPGSLADDAPAQPSRVLRVRDLGDPPGGDGLRGSARRGDDTSARHSPSVRDAIASLLENELTVARLTEGWARGPVHVRGEPDRFSGLVSWDDLGDLLDVAVAEQPWIVLLKQGAAVPAADYTTPISGDAVPGAARLDLVRLQASLRSGATLQINGADRFLPTVAEACRQFERAFRTVISSNVYLSYSAAGAAPTHWDAGDGIFLQVAGSKYWQVLEPVRRYPLARDVERSGQYHATPVWEGDLRAGEVLYVPRGWWHAPQPVGGEGVLSLHVTIGLEPVTAIDLLRWMADELGDCELFRQELPRFSSPSEQKAFAHAVWAQIAARWRDDIVGEFLDFQDAVAQPRGRSSLPWAIDSSLPDGDGFAIVSGTPRPIEPVCHEDVLVVEALGRRWCLDPVAIRFLRFILSGQQLRIQQLSEFVEEGLSLQDLRELVVTLVEDGLLAVVKPKR